MNMKFADFFHNTMQATCAHFIAGHEQTQIKSSLLVSLLGSKGSHYIQNLFVSMFLMFLYEYLYLKK